MTRPVPDLADPAQRRAYRAELMGVSRGLRLTGVALALLGSALILTNAYWTPIPNIVTWPVIVAGFVLMGLGISARTRYHRQRMRGEI